MKNKASKLFSYWRQFIEKKFTQLALVIIYFLGIGLTAILAKLLAKKFLDKNTSNSNWQNVDRQQQTKLNLEKMY